MGWPETDYEKWQAGSGFGKSGYMLWLASKYGKARKPYTECNIRSAYPYNLMSSITLTDTDGKAIMGEETTVTIQVKIGQETFTYDIATTATDAALQAARDFLKNLRKNI